MSFNLSPEQRIKKKNDFDRVFKYGFFKKFEFYNCCYLKNYLPISRLGIIVKKKYGKAVKRNYEKRIIREFFRLNQHILKNNYDLLILVKNHSSSYQEKKENFLEIINFIQNHEH